MAVASVAIILLLMSIGVDKATDINNFAAMSTYLLVDICIVWYFGIRKHPLKHSKGGVWRTIIIPAFGAIALGYVMLSVAPLAQITGWIWCFIGIGVYLIITRVRHKSIDLG